MTKNPTDTKQTNTNTTARSTSDPSDGSYMQSSPQNSAQTSSNNTGSDPSATTPLQPDPQHSDSADSNADQPSTKSGPQSAAIPQPSFTDQPSSASQQSQQSISASQQSQPQTQGSATSSPYGSFSDWDFDDTFDDLDSDTSLGFSSFGSGSIVGDDPSAGKTEKRMTPEERVQMIERIYNEIFQRSPDTRDINYYKYSTLSEDQIRRQLTASAEHTDMIKKGREYEGIKEHAEQLESRVNMLESQIKDHVEEFRELSNLLQEKNRLIQQLRANNSQALPHPKEGPILPEHAAQPIPTDDRGLQPELHTQENIESNTPETNVQVDSNPPSNADTPQHGLKEPSPVNFQTISTSQTPSPQPAPIFTSQGEAPPPPDIQTESGIITAEPNSLARRLKRAVKDLLRSFF